MIVTDALCFKYDKGREVLRDISITIKEGELVAILGGNGAGKTTLVKHFNGILRPTSGRVLVDGVDTREVAVHALARQVALIFQNPDYVLFRDSVQDELRYALKNFGLPLKDIWDRIDPILKDLKLDRYIFKSPFLLSEGERKRLSLACALAWHPKYIILDEPTIGQDSHQKSTLRNMFKRLNREGHTVIITSHDIEFVAECKPRIMLMKSGSVIADGPARDILTNDELLTKASLTRPQIARTFAELADLGFGTDILSVADAKAALIKRHRGAGGGS